MKKNKKIDLPKLIEHIQKIDGALINYEEKIPPKRWEKIIRRLSEKRTNEINLLIDEANRWEKYNTLKEHCVKKNTNLWEACRFCGYNDSIIGMANSGIQCPSHRFLTDLSNHVGVTL